MERWIHKQGRGLLVCVTLFALLGVTVSPGEARLAFLGDIMLGRGVAEVHLSTVGSGWEAALQGAGPLLWSADLRLANLESPLMQNAASEEYQPGSPYNLCAGLSGIAALTSARVGILSLANNHMDDCQADGAAQTQAILSRAGLVGIAQGNPPVYRKVNGLLLAFLAGDDVSAQLDLEAMRKQIAEARGRGAQVILSVHWGSEYQAGPNARQERLAQALADAGASIIWGHHPHVLQTAAWVQGQGQNHPTLVIYSLGNGLFDQVVPPDARRTAALLVEISPSGALGVQALPLEIDPLHGETRQASKAAAQGILNRLGENVELFDQ